MRKSKTRSSSFHPQPSEAEAAFLSLQAEIEALRDPQRATVDVQLAATIAHGVAQRDLEPERFERFERLASVELYDPELPERVSQLALAAWFARQRQMGRVALASDAKVPLDVVRGAQLQRGKMLKVLEYWLEDDAEIAAELAMIREGAGHLDLANDLEAVADLYQRPDVRVVIAEDRKHYDAADVEAARGHAKAIFAGLGLRRDSDAKRWRHLSLSSWTLLLRAYDEHAAAGTFLFRTLEDVTETYPSLVSAARRSPAPSRLTAVEEEDEPEDDDDGPAAALPEAVG